MADAPSLLLSAHCRPSLSRAAESECLLAMKGRMYSPRFPADHLLNPFFVRAYQPGDELGAGGYGFVMTARNRTEGHEVAVKFIIKDKVPEHAWWEDEMFGKVPTEVMLLSLVNHENIVKCLDLFEDEIYFYLVQELHGNPWVSRKNKKSKQATAPGKLAPSPSSTPSLTPSPSFESNNDSLPNTPPQVCMESPSGSHEEAGTDRQDSQQPQFFLQPPLVPQIRPNFSRRPSYDLFECIEQSKHKRLSENQARYIFAQVVEAVYYLDNQGITHCDIKDENLVIDSDLKVKLIDFGSAVVADPSAPRPYYTLFFGTTAYASSEILLKKPYRAPPAEIWTLGVLLSYLLTGHSPFPTEQDAKDGRIILREPARTGSGRLSRAAITLMGRCLEKEPDRRADIHEVRGHRWLQGALESHGMD
ncbi:kinase-like protein [Obba rivulosa]|uniref:Kinase-like protein n=1 Tax=Obba rivulosa TaxID=1052685 RepID=A0A8E2DSQ0_9APHY|nr:kinase-like protein [Obba rivulosa]